MNIVWLHTMCGQVCRGVSLAPAAAIHFVFYGWVQTLVREMLYDALVLDCLLKWPSMQSTLFTLHFKKWLETFFIVPQEHFKKEKEAEHQRKKEQRKAELAQK